LVANGVWYHIIAEKIDNKILDIAASVEYRKIQKRKDM
jgi:hypothetical protein